MPYISAKLIRVLSTGFIIGLCLVSVKGAICEAQGDRIVAVVNDMIITQSEVQEYINFASFQLVPEMGKEKAQEKLKEVLEEAITKLVEDKLILQEAIKEGIKVQDAVIEARLKEIKSRFPSEEDFNASLVEQHMSVSDIKKNLRNQELMRSIVDAKIRSKIYVSPQELTKFYEEHPDVFNVPEGRQVSVVSFTDKEDAQDAAAKLKSGSNFNQLFSSLESYRKLEEFKKGDLQPVIEEKIFKLGEGQVSEIIELEESFYIFKILKILSTYKLSLSQVQSRSHAVVFNEKFAREFTSWLDKLKEAAYITIR
jgi:peptidyl-prolyl cis-trans isomerase SurA